MTVLSLTARLARVAIGNATTLHSPRLRDEITEIIMARHNEVEMLFKLRDDEISKLESALQFIADNESCHDDISYCVYAEEVLKETS